MVFFLVLVHKYDKRNIFMTTAISERKGKTFEVYNEDISEENYDRKIWMARNPQHFKRNA